MISRLKSLELQGYKTFAKKTKFEFQGKINELVGQKVSGIYTIDIQIRGA